MTAPDTITHEGHRYIRWDIMAGIIARSISQVITETLTFHPKYGESAVPAEKATPCPGEATQEDQVHRQSCLPLQQQECRSSLCNSHRDGRGTCSAFETAGANTGGNSPPDSAKGGGEECGVIAAAKTM